MSIKNSGFKMDRKKICKYIKDTSRYIWSKIEDSKAVDVKIQEETVTETILINIAKDLYPYTKIKTFHKNEEGINGADWEWYIRIKEGEDTEGLWLGMIVQAKILNDNAKNPSYDSLWKIDDKTKKYQFEKLLNTAYEKELLPIYCFYNHLDNSEILDEYILGNLEKLKLHKLKSQKKEEFDVHVGGEEKKVIVISKPDYEQVGKDIIENGAIDFDNELLGWTYTSAFNLYKLDRESQKAKAFGASGAIKNIPIHNLICKNEINQFIKAVNEDWKQVLIDFHRNMSGNGLELKDADPNNPREFKLRKTSELPQYVQDMINEKDIDVTKYNGVSHVFLLSLDGLPIINNIAPHYASSQYISNQEGQ